MNVEILAVPAVILVSITSLILLIISDWRLSIAALGVQYLGVFLLVALHWPLEMAAAKLVAGWMAGAVLGMAAISLPRETAEAKPGAGLFEPLQPAVEMERLDPRQPAGRVFRFLAAILVGLAVMSVAPKLMGLMPEIEVEQVSGGLILAGMGLLHLGFTGRPLQTILGLLTTLTGFEILYSAVEVSTLVAGLLAGVTLGLALVGAYLLVAPQMEES